MDLINWIVFIVCILIFFSYSLSSSLKVKSENGYLLANRSIKLFPLIATLVMTEFNTATLVSFSAAGYYAHHWALTLTLVFFIGLLFYACVVAKHWKRFDGVSVAYFFHQRYGRDIGMFVAAILFLAMLGFSAVYIKSLALLFLPVFPSLSIWLLSGALVCIIFFMVSVGGLVSIVRIDVISFCLMMIALPVLVYYTITFPAKNNFISNASLAMMQNALPLKFILSLILLTMFSYILAPWYGQKVVAANSANTAFLAVIIAAFLIAALYGLGILASAVLKSKGVLLDNPEFAIPYLMNHVVPKYFRGAIYLIFFCVGATTLAGVWNAMVGLLVGQLSENNRMWRSYTLKFLCVLLSFLCANFFESNILNQMLLANIPIVALSFALLAGFYWARAKRISVYLSTLVGIFWGIFCYFHYGQQNLYTWHWAVIGIPLIFIIGTVSTILFEKCVTLKARFFC